MCLRGATKINIATAPIRRQLLICGAPPLPLHLPLSPYPTPPPGSIQNPCDSAFLSRGITMDLGRLRIVAAVKQRAGLSLYLIWSNSLSTCDMSHDLYVVIMIVIHWLELKIRCSAILLSLLISPRDESRIARVGNARRIMQFRSKYQKVA